MNELTYTRCGDYYIPDLELSEQPEAPIGKYGRMRRRYLKEHRPGLYSSLILSEKLYPHLLEIDRAAHERMDAMLPRMMEAAGVTEELKARDPMRWVGQLPAGIAQRALGQGNGGRRVPGTIGSRVGGLPCPDSLRPAPAGRRERFHE